MRELPKNPERKIDAITFSPDGKWLGFHVDEVTHVVDVSDTTMPMFLASHPFLQVVSITAISSFVYVSGLSATLEIVARIGR